ncbi:spindle and centriole-associated protein 1 isoform X2 [Varanus komodoensis]|uniref:spindle and centriole-associated protein 1 isoform X2 n=1 Tax=Varanus komodoensis TaxID=61221 RepID=UPI001CF76A64|nr:spindle and centriole-associated protein 1 isoform X2 [Varanus komodoensis]
MSLLRVSRFPTGAVKRPTKARSKKPPSKREWDSTVHDLTVHRATPEELVRRHEMHKSKNKALVHLELQEKALKSKRKKQRPRVPESLEKKKLALMREILSEQYQLQDVLERSDQAMAMVKDLFGDTPHRHLGFPNVTVAPDYDMQSSLGPIVQKSDPPTQLSILSESVMDRQAVNEVEHASKCKTSNENDVSLNFRSSVNTDRMPLLLKEENSVAIDQEEAFEQQASTISPQEVDGVSTPTTAYQLLEHTALNATNVVRKVHSRVQNEEQIPYTTFVVQQVLNANVRKEKQTVTKVKKKQSPQMPAGQKKKNLSTAATSFDLPNGNRTSLEVLNQMMHEMEEYEKWMGHEIQQVHDNQGVSGFTHSLVNALCRVMHYLKENERRMHQEMVDRQQLEKELGEHRALIDALTAEVLLLREENHAMQSKLQQCLVVRDEKLVSLSHALQGLSVTDISRRSHSGESGKLLVQSPELAKDEPILDYNGPKTNWLDALPVDLPNKAAVLNPPKKIHPTPTLSTHIFQPAVLLSPPQQKSSEALPLLQDDSTRRETDGEQISTPSHKPLMVQEDGSLLTQKVCVPVAIQTMHNSFRSHGQILENISAAPRPGFDDATEGIDPGVSMMCTQNEDLQEQINELTHQNSVIKTQLRAFGHCHEQAWDSLQQAETMQDVSDVERQGNGQTASSLKESKSLDERIAELNRQSAEARGKLLLLTNQQAVATFISVSPPVSPVFSPPRNLPENGRKTVEVSVPVVETLDGLKEDTFPPASGTSVRRSACVSNHVCLPLSTSLRNDRHRIIPLFICEVCSSTGT